MSKGSSNESILSIAIPTAVSMLTDSILNIIAISYVSLISDVYVGIIGLASYLLMIINSIASIFIVGALVAIAQSYGAGRLDEASRFFGESLILSIALSIPVAVTTYIFLDNYLILVSGGALGSLDVARSFMIPRIIGIPIIFINSLIASVYRGFGRAWPPAIYSITTIIISLLILPRSIELIHGDPYSQIFWISSSITISQYFSLIIYLILRSPVKPVISLPGIRSLKLMLIGSPAALERLVSSIGQNIYVNAVARGGAVALSAHSIGVNIETIIITPSFSIGIASSAVIGQAVGGDQIEKIDHLLKQSVKISLLWMSAVAIILISIAPFVGSLFTKDLVIQHLVAIYLILAALSEPGLGLSQAYYGAFRGMGSTYVPLIISVASVLLLRALPAQILANYYGAIGAWATQISDMYGRTLISIVLYKILRKRLVIKIV
ncbi:MAG: MATE family efflux transporter [Sulfolobales archaeon]